MVVDEAVYVTAAAVRPDHTPAQVVDVLIEQAWDDQEPWQSRDILGALPVTVALQITRVLLDLSDTVLLMRQDPVDLASAWVEQMAVAFHRTPPSDARSTVTVSEALDRVSFAQALSSDPDTAWASGVVSEPVMLLPYRLVVTVSHALSVAVASLPGAEHAAQPALERLHALVALPSSPKPRDIRAS